MRKKRKWLRRLSFGFLLLTALLVWLNGPGIRWLGPWGAKKYLAKLGVEGDFSLSGSLTGGLAVENLKIGGGLIPGEITALKIAPLYRFREAVRGNVDGIVIDGMHAVIDLDKQVPEKDEPPPEPFDPQKLADTLRGVRARLLPLDIRLTDIRVDVMRGARRVVSIGSTSLGHRPGAEDFFLKLGGITDTRGQVWPAQETAIHWEVERLMVDKLDPLPDIGVRGLALRMPIAGEPSAETRILVDDAALQVDTGAGFRDVRADLREGRIEVEKILLRLGIELPLKAVVSSLSVNTAKLLDRPEGEVRLLLENVDYDGWQVPQINLDVRLEETLAQITAKARALDTDVALDVSAPVERAAGIVPGDVKGALKMTDVPALWKKLAERFPQMAKDAEVPASSLDAAFAIAMREGKPVKANVDATLKPVRMAEATPLRVTAVWEPEKPLQASAEADGLQAKAAYDVATTDYKAQVLWNDFRKARIERWLALAQVKVGGKAELSGDLTASGNARKGTHEGALTLLRGAWSTPDRPEITAMGRVDYRWPGEVKVMNLRANSGKQEIAFDALLSGGELDVSRLVFHENDKRLLDGSMNLPMPQDFSRWKEMIATEKRPIRVEIESQALSLPVLKNWLPALAEFDPASTGKVKFTATGTYANPAIDGRVELKNLRRAAESGVPPADVALVLKGGGGKLAVDGKIITPGYAPAVLDAKLDFLPAKWAENPETVKLAAINARLVLPQVRLGKFKPLVPALRDLDGTVDGNAVVSGTLGKPAVAGEISLTGGRVKPDPAVYSEVRDISARVDFSLDRVELKSLKATAAGGTVTAAGGFPMVEGRPGPVNLTIKGDHLLLKRDDKVVARANVSLAVKGPLDGAVVSGDVEVVDSLFFRDVELIPVGVPFVGPSAASLPKLDAATTAAPTVPAPFGDWRLDVRLRTGMPFLIRGNLGTGSITADVRVTGTAAKPEPRGVVMVNEAVLALPYSTLRVRRGIVRFTGDLDPDLEIRGLAEPRPYRVFLYAYGSASNPQMVLTSSPPLPQNEIMTLLATGTTSSGLEDSKMATSRALQLLAEEARRGRLNIARPLRPLLKFADRVDFTLAEEDPYTSEKYSTATVSFTDKWLLSASMGDEGESRVMGIWRLTFR